MDETIIKIENAALKLKKFVIKPANLEIPKGYIVGVQGENGAGKTTLLHMMLGMYDKMKGKIYIDGLDVVKNKTKVKEIVGIGVAGQEILPVAGCQWKRKNIQSIL